MGDVTRFCVVLGITGSIAAYKAADLIRKLRALRDPQHSERRVDVRVVLTPHGAEFITATTLQTLSGNQVYSGLFQAETQWDVQHIGLADDADLLLIAPATANIMGKMVAGIADDLLSTIAMAITAPVLLAPAMNVHMWDHPANQANARVLQQRGVAFIGPDAGELACGYEGRGRMASVAEITSTVEKYFICTVTAQDFAGKSVVITAGPTREHLDPVRYLSNPSTGKMGYALARAAAARGAQVTLISGPVSLSEPPGVTVVHVTATAEMAAATLQAAQTADVVIGAAAPADFTPAHRTEQKVKKTDKAGETLELVPTTDILATVGARKHPGQVIVAFAAETEKLEAYAVEKLARKHADLMVANDVTQPGAGFAADTNRALLLYPDGRREELPLQAKEAMATRILDAVAVLMKPKD